MEDLSNSCAYWLIFNRSKLILNCINSYSIIFYAIFRCCCLKNYFHMIISIQFNSIFFGSYLKCSLNKHNWSHRNRNYLFLKCAFNQQQQKLQTTKKNTTGTRIHSIKCKKGQNIKKTKMKYFVCVLSLFFSLNSGKKKKTTRNIKIEKTNSVTKWVQKIGSNAKINGKNK